jgi:hypothetical protein
MILGLDISTSKIGVALINNSNDILVFDFVKFDKSKSLEERAKSFSEYIEKIINEYGIFNNNHHDEIGQGIKKILVEEPFVSFQGGSSAKTVSVLQRYNGMCCYVIYNLTGIIPDLLNPNIVRSKLNIKIPRGTKKKSDKKKPIIEYVKLNYPKINIEYTNQGNVKPGFDDACDAVCLCNAARLISP